MGESDRKSFECTENSKCIANEEIEVSESAMSVDLLKVLVPSFMQNDRESDLLPNKFTQNDVELPDAKNLEIFVDSLLKYGLTKLHQNTTLSINSFRCAMCGDIMSDPVTLTCGHTFSKKCLLSASVHGLYECVKCSKSHSYAYILHLKRNIKVLSLIENFKNFASCRNYTFDERNNGGILDSSLNKLLDCTSVKQNYPLPHFSPMYYLRDGDDLLVNFRKYKEAIVSYLVCCTLDPTIYEAKRKVLKELDKLCTENQFEDKKLQPILNMFYCEIEKLRGECLISKRIHMPFLDKKDFECSLCMRILWQPVTTTCGHTFCRNCLYRCFDHQPMCPLCKTSLVNFLAERVDKTTELLEIAIETLLPNEYIKRKEIFQEEMNEIYRCGKNAKRVLPLFICTIAFPTVPCPLHVFEPQYRLMIRQCMESESCQFGMCAVFNNSIAEYGTILEIRDVRYFPDGRSAVDTIGRSRFHILKKGMRDGYHTAEIELVQDEVSPAVDKQVIEEMHDQVYKISQVWFSKLPQTTKYQIWQHFGPMPNVENDYLLLPNGPTWFWWMVAILPLEPNSQYKFLSMTSLFERLKILYKMISHLLSNVMA